MNRTHSLTASAALFAWSMVPVYAAPRNKDSSTEAQKLFERIDAQSEAIASTAFAVGETARWAQDSETIPDGLELLRADVNKIGEEIHVLEAERAILPTWEQKTLERILPFMHDAADNAEKAIETFNSGPRELRRTPFTDETFWVSKDAEHMATILRDNLKLVKTRDQELRIERELGESSGF